jgi:zinc D-Ala-D-Ala carboxypeptidase
MNLSPHFTLKELTGSQTATRKGYSEQFNPPQDVVDNLTHLCVNLLEKVREKYGKPLKISSGYRCDRTNKAVGGSKTSQHVKGEAADLDTGSREENKKLFEIIKNSGLDFDQVIDEYDFDWVHVSLRRGKNRKMILKIS